jgi:hypothetical protein
VPAGNVAGDDVGAKIIAFEQYGRGFDTGDLARSGAIAAIDHKTVLIDDNRVNETVRLDVRSEVGQFLVGHHREQIGDWVDRPRHSRLPRFGDDRPSEIIRCSFSLAT